MKKTIQDYKEAILSLPLKNTYKKEELLIPPLQIEKEGNVEIYYAPHNEHINPKAKVFIIGITPGFQQLNEAIVTARKGLEEGKSIPQIQYECKAAARFSGSLRKNIISMLDEIGLNQALGITTCEELFTAKDELLHTVSLIPYSVFVKGANYSGHTPKLLKSEFLMKYIYENFLEEYNQLQCPKEVLLIPLGRAVEEVLVRLSDEGKVERNQILLGFPHPSGANVNRLSQLRENKPEMMAFLEAWSKEDRKRGF
ncbi:MAG: hypothetical protein Q4F05_03545 [bacterium]|nr:hypothetical protein [bacterium]